jgi:hypothetical protein
MLSRRTFVFMTLHCVALLLCSAEASAQFYNQGCSSCGPAVAATCTPIQPVYYTSYQTVPVTTYAREKKTVEVPYYRTTYEDREYTQYRPVSRRREVEVPTVSYQNVVEYRTATRDMGRWITRYQPTQKRSPCNVDPRPGVLGWLNRTGYAFQTAFVPNYTTSRQYVPSMVACRVPVTRRVAVRGTRRVTMIDTEMVAERKTEKVAVQKLAYRKEEITVMRPQTAYRKVPIGTTMAYGPGYGGTVAYAPYFGNTATAMGLPVIESDTRTSLAPSPDPLSRRTERRADNSTPFRDDSESDTERSFRRAESPEDDSAFQRSSLQQSPAFPDDSKPAFESLDSEPLPTFGPSTQRTSKSLVIPVSLKIEPATPEPTVSSGWKASSQRSGDGPSTRSGIKTARVSLADSSASDNK